MERREECQYMKCINTCKVFKSEWRQRTDAQNKAMLDSWVLSERTYEASKTFYSYGTTFDPIGSMASEGFGGGQPQTPNKQAYGEYSWLFGKPK